MSLEERRRPTRDEDDDICSRMRTLDFQWNRETGRPRNHRSRRKVFWRRRKLRSEGRTPKLDDGSDRLLRNRFRDGSGANDRRRVVITGLGVLAAKRQRRCAISSSRFARGSIGNSRVHDEDGGVRASAAHVAGVPQGVDETRPVVFRRRRAARDEFGSPGAPPSQRVDAWTDAGIARPERDDDRVDWDSWHRSRNRNRRNGHHCSNAVVPLTDAKKVRRLGSVTAVEQVMSSGVSARVSGYAGVGKSGHDELQRVQHRK